MAARPNRIGNPGAGVLFLGEGLSGVVGVRGPLTLRRPLFIELLTGEGATREIRRCEVESDEVDLSSTDPVRLRAGPWLAVSETGDCAVSECATMGFSSASCHWRCKMTDLVAHFNVVSGA
jgi:hypothetical protein